MRAPFAILRHAIILAAGCCGVLLSSPPAAGQSVFGAVAGTVSDSLGPAAGVRVSLAGSAFTAVTDLSGRFAVDHVPAGTYVVRAERTPGTASGEVAGVRVTSDATVTVAIRLGERSAAAETTAEGGLATRATVTGTRLAALPIDDSRQGVALLPGVVERGTDLGIAAYPSLTIRGSAADQTAVFVDGAPARFETAGTSMLALPADAVLEATLVTGAPAASLAEARGASIGYVTRAGGPRFEAGLTAGTDGPFSRNATVGFNRFDGFAGGSVPGVPRLTWFVSGGLVGQSSQYRGRGADTVPTFALAGVDTAITYTDPSSPGGLGTATAVLPRFAQVSGSCGQLGGDSGATARQIRANYGLACQGLRQRLDWTTSRRAQAKLLYSYGDGSSLSLSAVASDLQQRDPPGAALADNALYTGTRAHSVLTVLNWSHRLDTPRGTVTLLGNLAFGWDAAQSGPLDLASGLATADPALGIEFSRLRFAGLEGLPLPLTDAVVRQMRSGTFQPPYYQRNDLAPYQAFRFNPYGLMPGWPTTGFAGEATVLSESRLSGRLGAEWRATPSLVAAAGVDFSRTDLSYYDAPIVTGFGYNGVLAHPRRTGLFAQATWSTGPLVVEAGARGDRYVTGSDFPKLPGRIWSNPAWDQGDTSYAARISRLFDPGRTQTFLSPRLRVGFRVGEHTLARAGVSRAVDVPPYALLFANVNSDLAGMPGAGPFGRDVSYVSATLIELGIRHALRPSLAVDLSGYEKTNPIPYQMAGVPVYDPVIGGPPNVSNESLVMLTPTAGTRTLGGELRLEWAGGGPVSGTASYSIDQTRLPRFARVLLPPSPTDLTTQALSAALALRVPDGWAGRSAVGAALRGVSATIAARLVSGAPYTPLQNQGAGTLGPWNGVSGAPLGEAYSASLPWTKSLDLRLAKAVEVRGARVSAYVEARNVLNLDNLLAVFAETAKDENQLFRANVVLPQLSGLQADAGWHWMSKQVTVNGVTQTLNGVDLSDCSTYPQGLGGEGVVDCIALRRVEARWGNGDQFYDTNEITRAITAWYDAVYGTWAFHGPARTARVGIRIEF